MKKIIAGLLVISLSACGWHLRGSAEGKDTSSAPIELSIATDDNYSPLLNILRQSLRAYTITETTGKAPYILTVGKENMDKRTAGVGVDALTSAYEVILSVEYSITRNAELLTAPKTKASISRTYNYNINNAATAAQEEALILRELRRELAQQILRRLKNLNDKHLNNKHTPKQGDKNAEAAR